MRDMLAASFSFPCALPGALQESRDGTVKAAFSLHDGNLAEGVFIPSGSRTTACISSQAGCPLGCRFCATGQMGFRRSLSAGEIVDQVRYLDRLSRERKGVPLSNIVYMGMGEPLLNYEAVTESIARLTSPEGMGLSPQRITLSSVGIPKMIRKLADDGARVHFALSLHAATDEKRNQIIPFNRQHPLDELTAALKYYHTTTGKRFTIEYILFRGFNDSQADARDLARFCKSFPVKVNLIEYNPVEGTGQHRPDPESTRKFAAFLESLNMVVNVRRSRGEDIDAACGQLAGKNQPQPNLSQ
jgi:23S rRNA (adenine2503-C2)-methyltransferase